MDRLFHAKGHEWVERTVTHAGDTAIQRQCILCRRNFLLRATEEGWRAVEVGIIEFKFLDDVTNALWLTESCPGVLLPAQPPQSRFSSRRK